MMSLFTLDFPFRRSQGAQTMVSVCQIMSKQDYRCLVFPRAQASLKPVLGLPGIGIPLKPQPSSPPSRLCVIAAKPTSYSSDLFLLF